MSVHATARAFVLAAQTVMNWKREVRDGVARLVQARPPVNRLPDLVEHITRILKRDWPRWGTRRIAGILAKLSVAASRASVQRMLRRAARGRARREPRACRGTLRAKRPLHVWLIDFTRVRSCFRSVVVGAVVDAFSRKVVALRVSRDEPDAAFACALMRDAIARHGKPCWVITDQGTQFTSRRFSAYLARRRIRRRLGAVGRPNSIATIERWWRSMKSEAIDAFLVYRPLRAIEARLRRYAAWFGAERPHAGLALRTPDEVHYARAPRAPRCVTSGALTVRFMAGDRRLPIFRLREAA